jgi:crotonobetaine/carnitine-CoA ligase
VGDGLDLRDLCELRAADSGESPFLVTDDEEVSYAEFDRRVNSVANGLAALGVGAGSRVGLFLGNRAEFVYAWFALAKLAAEAVPVNAAFAAPELRYVLTHAGTTVLVTEPALFERAVAPVRDELGALATLVLVGGDGGVPFTDLLAESPEPPPRRPIDDGGTTFTILYTSGTTGYPRGCMLPQRYFVLNGGAICHGMAIGHADRILMPLPLFHVNAEITVVGTMVNRAAYLLRPRFSASAFWGEARRFGATAFNHVGTMITLLAKQPESTDDRAHDVRVSCGGGAPRDLIAPFERRFGVRLVELYATTESCMDTMGSAQSTGPPQPPGSAGAPVWFKEVQIQGSDGRPLPPGTVGEICTRPKLPGAIMLGYFRDPDATRTALAGGWFHSGDLGRVDDAGFLYFVDRQKHVIRRSGEQISSLEIERVLKGHPAVLEAAVVPVPDEVRGEEVKACVVLRPAAPADFDPRSLFAFCAGELAAFKVPRYVKLYDALPMTETQRIKKYELKDEQRPLENAIDRLEA